MKLMKTDARFAQSLVDSSSEIEKILNRQDAKNAKREKNRQGIAKLRFVSPLRKPIDEVFKS
jgi:hypothetical protein